MTQRTPQDKKMFKKKTKQISTKQISMKQSITSNQCIVNELSGNFTGNRFVGAAHGGELTNDRVLWIDLELLRRQFVSVARIHCAHHATERCRLVIGDNRRRAGQPIGCLDARQLIGQRVAQPCAQRLCFALGKCWRHIAIFLGL